MKATSIKTPLSLLALALSTAILSGCGSDSESIPDPVAPPPPPPPPAATDFPVQQASPARFVDGDVGEVFTTETGLTLYYFLNDEAGSSNCNGVEGDAPGSTTDETSCAGVWPPLLAATGAQPTGSFSTVERDDGTLQWAYRDFPLYTFSNDSAQGDTNGEGINDVWFVSRPGPSKIADVNSVPSYVGNGTISSVTSTAEVLESVRLDKEGFSLYIFDNDGLDQSACYGLNGDGCITAWPPLIADNAAKPAAPLSVVELENGLMQWAYRGKPLYFFASDTQAGDFNGDGVGGVWHLASQLPAIQREVNAQSRLSATGRVYALLPNTDNNNELESQQVDKDQFTVYTFDNDTAGTSNCNGDCAVAWPPFLAPDAEPAVGNFSKIERTDGAMQWAYNDSPLYFFSGDNAKTDLNGDGVGGVWHIVEPPAAPVVSPTSISALSNSLGQTIKVDGEVLALITDNQGNSEAVTEDRTDFQLYTFDNDGVEQSNCTSTGCMQNWPALLANEADTATAPFSIFERADGHNQWAFNGQPLYFFTGDTSAGTTNGEGVGDVWFVARPAPVRVFNSTDDGLMIVANDLVLASQGKTAEQLNDLTLYTFDDDTANSGESTCFGGCAVTWPPLYATSADQAFGEYEIISRTESDSSQTLQWTYKGLPLYFFISDSELGDTGGDYPTWEIARP
ncbi:MAG: hypothetical protein Alis3KO_15820 [Aliiglaciecola sp.]